jgi:hypothetical protein
MNFDYLNILRDPLVLPYHAVNTNVLVRTLSGTFNRAVCFTNLSADPISCSLSITNLGFYQPVFTYYSPYFHSIEGWASNLLTVTVPPTNTLMYQVRQGLLAPQWSVGWNFLSDFYWTMETNPTNDAGYCSPSITKDKRANGEQLNINGTAYAKGLSFEFGPKTGTNIIVTFPLGGAASSFSFDFGPQLGYEGGTPVRAIVLLDNVLDYTGIWWTTGPHTITRDVTGALFITLSIQQHEAAGEDVCAGNCRVLVTNVVQNFWPKY